MECPGTDPNLIRRVSVLPVPVGLRFNSASSFKDGQLSTLVSLYCPQAHALHSHSLRMLQLDLQCAFPVIFPSFTQPVQVVLLIFGPDRMLPVSLFSYPTIY